MLTDFHESKTAKEKSVSLPPIPLRLPRYDIIDLAIAARSCIDRLLEDPREDVRHPHRVGRVPTFPLGSLLL